MPEAFENADVPFKLWSERPDITTARRGRLTAGQAAQKLAVDASYLRRLENRSATFIRRAPGPGGLVLYDKESIWSLASALECGLRPREVSRRLGIPLHCLPAFIAAGLIQAIGNGDATIVAGVPVVSPSTVEALTEQVQTWATERELDTSLFRALRRRGHPNDWIVAFRAVLSGEFPIGLLQDSTLSLTDRVMVEREAVEHSLRRQQGHADCADILISCEAASEVLGVGVGIITAAAAAGLLGSTTRGSRVEYPLDSVLDFQRRFLGLAELSERSGLSVQALRLRLRGLGRAPVLTAGKRTAWDRADTERAIFP